MIAIKSCFLITPYCVMLHSWWRVWGWHAMENVSSHNSKCEVVWRKCSYSFLLPPWYSNNLLKCYNISFSLFILCRQQNAFCMNPRMTHQMTTKLPCHMHNKRNQVCDIKIIRSLSFVSHAYVEFNETGGSWWWLLSLETLHHVVINLDV